MRDTVLVKPYCSLIDVQEEIRNTDASNQNKLITAINRASRMIEDKTKRFFHNYDHTDTPFTVKRNSVIGSNIVLPFPILTLTSVEEDGTEVDITTVGWSSDSRTLTKQGAWATLAYKDSITLYGTFGYTLNDGADDPDTEPCVDIPEQIRRAATLIAAAYSHLNRRQVITIDGDRKDIADNEFPAEAKQLLKMFMPQVL